MRGLVLGAALLIALPPTSPAEAARPAAKSASTTKSAAKAKPAARNWLATTARTPEGAIVIGNPAARVKLVEYLSMTCPHCAVLSGQALPPLQRDYIAKGSVSLEVRHAVRDGFDFAASLLLRCEPPTQYLGSIEALFATQAEWIGRGAGAESAPGFAEKTNDEKIDAAAKGAGFDSFFAKRGLGPKGYAACMANEGAKQQLANMAGNSWERDKIPGTPYILINGQPQDHIMSWADLEPKLKAALR